MGDEWAIIIFALLAVAAPLVGYFIPSSDLDAAMEASFGDQVALVGGQSVPARELDVIFRSRTMSGRSGCSASWICRGPHDVYLLAFVEGQRERFVGAMTYTWTWRRLTEERARHALMADKAAYKAAFGE
ncbi:hypothetical protein [Dyella japonica]|uniref:Uncharacterized protein n=1 Tax=Dyella japonica TaxID=231455 RepID=A0ABV2JVQ4_9GAMM